ncbi:methyltransferase [Psychromonas sp. KJ10-2]|uniref:methyltransferase n=1 Tax=Psychromonas sp. KJ10-2 TaxID=3391822 RepID=UPI0039B57213
MKNTIYSFLIRLFTLVKRLITSAAEGFINESAKFLKKKGRLTIVANKFLRYEPLLIQAYQQFSEDAQNNKFKVLSCLK